MRTISSYGLICAALLALPAAGVAQGGRATVAARGAGVDRLARIDSLLEQQVAARRIAGAVAVVMRDGEIVYERAMGWADREAGRRMTPGHIFRIASQTKAITSVAALMLAEEGKLSLSDPVSRWLPSFAHTTVAVKTDSGRVLVPAQRPITVKDLLTHTSGISYGGESLVAPLYQAKGLGSGAGYGWYTADKNEPICETMDRLGTLPFVRQPGEAWVYGYSTDVLGCVVERASGRTLDEFIRTRITGPLGMRDTHFFLPTKERDRLTAVYAPDSAGLAVRAPTGPRGQGDYVDGPRRSYSGGAGLLSTARDYARFLEMIRRGGTLDGVRYLSPESVAAMTSNQVGGLYTMDGLGFGLGFQTVERAGAVGASSVGAFGWGGAYGSTYKVDPAERMVVVFLIQVVPYNQLKDLQQAFDSAVYEAFRK
jgi:CubicO group peptidase (beta-lactamase class C family)